MKQGENYLMKRFVFYLDPKGHEIWQESVVYFSVIISNNIERAAYRFSNLYGSVYSGMIKVTMKKYHVFFTKEKGQQKEELMYIVIEDEKNIFK